MTDSQIEILLARSSRKMRKRWYNKASKVNTGITDRNGLVRTGMDGVRFGLQNPQPSKKGYTVEYVNENAGKELNDAEGVVCEEINQVFDPVEAPEKGFQGWIAEKVRQYNKLHPLNDKYNVPALNGKVEIADSSIRSLGNHGGPDEKYNLIPVIPQMLHNAILIQSENFNNRSKSHLLATKVRYGKNDRYVAVMVIHENNGKLYYDHSLLILKEGELGKKINAEVKNGNPTKTAGSSSNSASVLKIAQNALLSSGFNVNLDKNVRFSIAPEDDAAYLDAVNNGDMETAGKIIKDTAEESGLQIIPKDKLKKFTIYTGLLGIPSKISMQMINWEYTSKSPYSHSYYSKPGKSWEHTPEGVLRVADHWNFESRGETHCRTDFPVENNSHWTIAEYRNGVYHVLDSLPKLQGDDTAWRKQIIARSMENARKEYPRAFTRRKSPKYLDDRIWVKYKNGNLLGRMVNYDSGAGNFYHVDTTDGRQIRVSKDNATIISVMDLVSAGEYAIDPLTNSVKSIDPVTYDDQGNVIPLSQRFNSAKPDIRFSVANDDGIDPEIQQAFPRYQSSQAKDILKKIARKDLKNIETGIDAQINTNQYKSI